MELEPHERPPVTGQDVRLAYESMGLRRAEAAEIIGISELRLAHIEQENRPLFTHFNWEVLARLGNEHHRRREEAELPECEWLVDWTAGLPDDDALAELSQSEIAALEGQRSAHCASCDPCVAASRWEEENPDPIALLFPPPERPIEKLGRWLPLGVLVVGAIGGVMVGEATGRSALRLVGLVVGFAVFLQLQRARRQGYLP